MKVEWDDNQKAAVRHLCIHAWPSLSRDDRSIILRTLNDQNSCVMVLAGTPHAEFWEDMIVLEWGTENQINLDMTLPFELRQFEFTEFGRLVFPVFFERYDLQNLVVREEQSEIRNRLRQHVDEVFKKATQAKWIDLADRLPINEILVIPNDRDYYVASDYEARWSINAGGSIDIIVNGFVHHSHHKPIFTKKMTLYKDE